MANVEKTYDFKKIAAAIEKKQGLRSGAKRKAWFLTLNNPCEHIPECSDMQPEEVVDWANRHWCMNSKGELRKNRGSGCCYERGLKEHTDHIHIVLCAINTGCTAEVVVRAFPMADVEIAKGSVEDLRDYLAKTGKHADKEDTTVVSPRYMGEAIVDNPNAKESREDGEKGLSRTESHRKLVLDAIWKDNYSYEDILADPELSVYASGMRKDMLLDSIAARDNAVALRQKRVVRSAWCADSYSMMTTVEAARNWLVANYGTNWGEWKLGNIAQPALNSTCKAVLVVWPSSCDGVKSAYTDELANLVSSAPFQVRRTYDDFFWAAWNTVLICSPYIARLTCEGCSAQFVLGKLLSSPLELEGFTRICNAVPQLPDTSTLRKLADYLNVDITEEQIDVLPDRLKAALEKGNFQAIASAMGMGFFNKLPSVTRNYVLSVYEYHKEVGH